MDTTCRCDRRTVLQHAAVGAAGASALALSACGGSDSGSGAGSSGSTSSTATWQTALEAGSLPAVGTTTAATTGDQDLLVHRAGEDEVLVYSSICTHQGCTVEPGDEEFTCPCHQSTFAAADGSVTGGPAQSPLPSFESRITDDGAVEVKV